MVETELERARAAFVTDQLRACENAWREGSLPALAKAIQLCHRYERPLPAWAVHGALAAVSAQFDASTAGRRGRLANRKVAHQQDMIHYARWDAVKELRDRREELGGIASTWEEAYAAVAELLEGTEAAGSEATIKRSYQLVERAFRNGEGARFYQADMEPIKGR